MMRCSPGQSSNFAIIAALLALSHAPCIGDWLRACPADVTFSGGACKAFARIDQPIPPGTRLLVASGVEPLGWLTQSARHPAQFEAASFSAPLENATLRTWLVLPTISADLREQWPEGVDLAAPIESVGPGGRTVWLERGADDGARAGDFWLVRLRGQPIAKLEILLTDARVSFCRVFPLAENPPLKVGMPATCWPRPADARDGGAGSAVGHVEHRGDAQFAWTAAPPGIDLSAGVQVQFHRDGRLIALGEVETADNLFAYVRILSGVAGPDTVAFPAASLLVGDEARIRTPRESSEGRYAARVFARSPEGLLINAGEAELLSIGQTGTLFRDETAIATARVQRVQRGYSILVVSSDTAAPGIRAGDVFGDRPPMKPRPIGRVAAVRDGDLLSVELVAGANATPHSVFALRAGDAIVGATVLIDRQGDRAMALVLPGSAQNAVPVWSELIAPAR